MYLAIYDAIVTMFPHECWNNGKLSYQSQKCELWCKNFGSKLGITMTCSLWWSDSHNKCKSSLYMKSPSQRLSQSNRSCSLATVFPQRSCYTITLSFSSHAACFEQCLQYGTTQYLCLEPKVGGNERVGVHLYQC